MAIIAAPANGSVFERGATVTFDGRESYAPNGTIEHYRWTSSDCGCHFTGAVFSHEYLQQGNFTITLEVTDDRYRKASTSIIITIGDWSNEKPLAIIAAPTDGALLRVNTTVRFDANGSYDPDGEIVFYRWDLGDGACDSRCVRTGASIDHRYSATGNYTVHLEVTDDDGAGDTAWIELTVVDNATNLAPVPQIAAPTDGAVIATGTELTLDSTGSYDPDGVIIAYRWHIYGGATELTYENASCTHRFESAGSYALQLTVTDDNNASATSAITTVTVTATAAQPPVAVIAAPADGATVTLGEPVEFDANGSYDPDGTIRDYTWDLGAVDCRCFRHGKLVFFRYDAAGTYTVTLRVIDQTDLVDAAVIRLHVLDITSPTNQPPVARLSAPAPNSSHPVGTLLRFDAGASYDLDGTAPVAFEWRLDGRALATTGPILTLEADAAMIGAHTLQLIVADEIGETDTIIRSFHIVSASSLTLAPHAKIALDRPVAAVDTPIRFDASGSVDTNASIAHYHWSLGDGTAAQGCTVTHRYDHEGGYDIELTVENELGQRANATATIEVVPNDTTRAVIASPAPNATYAVGAPVIFADASIVAPTTAQRAALVPRWSFSHGRTATGSAVLHAFDTPGSYRVRLELLQPPAMEPVDETAVEIQVATRTPTSPRPQLEVTTATSGAVVQFNATTTTISEDSGTYAPVVAYDWWFADGSFATGDGVTHTFTSTGCTLATLTAFTLDGGWTSTAFLVVTERRDDHYPSEPSSRYSTSTSTNDQGLVTTVVEMPLRAIVDHAGEGVKLIPLEPATAGNAHLHDRFHRSNHSNRSRGAALSVDIHAADRDGTAPDDAVSFIAFVLGVEASAGDAAEGGTMVMDLDGTPVSIRHGTEPLLDRVVRKRVQPGEAWVLDQQNGGTIVLVAIGAHTDHTIEMCSSTRGRDESGAAAWGIFFWPIIIVMASLATITTLIIILRRRRG